MTSDQASALVSSTTAIQDQLNAVVTIALTFLWLVGGVVVMAGVKYLFGSFGGRG